MPERDRVFSLRTMLLRNQRRAFPLLFTSVSFLNSCYFRPMSQDEWHAGFLATTTRPKEVGSKVEKSRKKTRRRGIKDTREGRGFILSVLQAPEKKLEVVLEERRSWRDGERIRRYRFPRPRMLSSPLLFALSLLSFSARSRGVRRLRGAMPCYPRDVWRANCARDRVLQRNRSPDCSRTIAYPPSFPPSEELA